MDGTLLPPTKIMPEETFPLIKKFTAAGGVFAPASGRQLPNLKKLFAPVLDDVAIIAENGGLVYYKGDVIFSDPTPEADIVRALEIIRGVDRLYPVLSCADCAYYEDDCPRFIRTLNRSYSATEKVESLRTAAMNNTALKISVWDSLPAAEHGGVILPPLIKGLRTLISGYDWVDVCREGANKGKALCALMNFLGVEKGECAAFGDHMNDYEMLAAAGRAYVTANGFPALKERIGEIIASNADFGVIEKMKQLIG